MIQEPPADEPHTERRKFTRRELILDLRVRTPSGAELGQVGNLAIGGLQLLQEYAIAPGEELDLELDLPSSLGAGLSLSVRGVCRWVKGERSGRRRCGIEFLGTTPEHEELIKSLIGRFVGELSWEKRTDTRKEILHLRGALDQRAAIEDLAAVLAPPFNFDLADLVRISSWGARRWRQLVGQLASTGPITLRRCSPAFVACMNMISDFKGPVQILSVNAPYICENCDVEYAVEVGIPAALQRLPAPACTTCGESLVFDDFPAQFFAFQDRP